MSTVGSWTLPLSPQQQAKLHSAAQPAKDWGWAAGSCQIVNTATGSSAWEPGSYMVHYPCYNYTWACVYVCRCTHISSVCVSISVELCRVCCDFYWFEYWKDKALYVIVCRTYAHNFRTYVHMYTRTDFTNYLLI